MLWFQLIEGKQSHKHGGGTDQSEFDELRGRNDELRNELKRVRGEQVKLSSDKSNLQNQVLDRIQEIKHTQLTQTIY